MAHNMNHVACPKCKAVCILPGEGPEALSTNVYVLNNIQLKNLVTNQQLVTPLSYVLFTVQYLY